MLGTALCPAVIFLQMGPPIQSVIVYTFADGGYNMRLTLSVMVVVGMVIPARAGLVSFIGSGADTAALNPTVAAFQAALGGANNGNNACTPTPCTNGFRTINWDGVP